MKDLKTVYQSPNEEADYQMLMDFEEKWGSQYPQCIKLWKDNWSVFSPFFSYSANIRKIMYTTNIIENLNRQYHKVTKGKPIYPTDTALMKSLYLATENATKKWSQRQRNWAQIINKLSILNP